MAREINKDIQDIQGIQDMWIGASMPGLDPFANAGSDIENTFYYEKTDEYWQGVINNNIVLDYSSLNVGLFMPIEKNGYDKLVDVADIVVKKCIEQSKLGTFGFVSKKQKIIKASAYQTQYMLTIAMCIHRPSKAYGKLVKMQCLICNESHDVRFLYVGVCGDISQDVIDMVGYSSSYSGIASYSAPV